MNTLFGTDGIRGVANKYPMDCETVLKIGRVIAKYFGSKGGSNKILIARDTRVSGYMITSAVASGVCSMGVDVVLAGVMPTPGVARLLVEGDFCAGVVVTASHNKFYDNGIKMFSGSGYKLTTTDETELERMIKDFDSEKYSLDFRRVGRLLEHHKYIQKYNKFLEKFSFYIPSINKMKIILDCSNGATSICAPMIFRKICADVINTFCFPNGTNINDRCGSEYPENMIKILLKEGADIGLAFDGDGDRLTAVSELGEILTGDQLLVIFAYDLLNRGLLKNQVVVSTVMSNLGLGIAFKKMGIKHIQCAVGDKDVIRTMKKAGAVLGGENSGHMFFLDYQNTGDAMLAALQLVGIMKRYNKSLSELSRIMTVSPQYLMNVNVISKPNLANIPIIQNAILDVKRKLGNSGRILVRYSGTQPKCRIMIEGANPQKIKRYCNDISNVISKYFHC